MRKVVGFAAVGFVLFLIFTNPAISGVEAGRYAGFIGDFLGALADFVRALLGPADTGDSFGTAVAG